MKFFKSPAFIIILSAILIVSSTVLTTRRKLGGKCDDVTELFYADTSEQRSIASLLREIAVQSMTLSAIAEDYGIDVEDFSDQADWLDSALRYSRGSESYIYSEYSALTKSYNNLRRQLDAAELSAQDAALVTQAESFVDEVAAQISALSADYNSTVRSFNRRYSGFPASFMAEFAGVSMPEAFA